MLTPLFGVGWTEVLVIAGVVFVLFGASRIPAAFRSLGEGINSFKEGLEGKNKGAKDGKEGKSSSDEARPRPATDEGGAEE
jgi:sec-independent protein translocase protein TatA